MRGSELKRKLQAGEVCLGSWLTCSDVALADVLSHCGFDFIVMDMEHAPLTLENVQQMNIPFRDAPAVSIARIPWNDAVYCKQVLDAGTEGVLVPWVNTAAEARAAVAACKYPPLGVRGIAPRLASDYGRSRTDYLKTANDRTVVMCQIETQAAVDNLDEMLQVPGVDVYFVGPADLSASMGYTGEPNHPAVIRVIDDVIARCCAAGKVCGTVSNDADECLQLIRRGMQLVTISGDFRLMQMAAMAALEKVRANLGATD